MKTETAVKTIIKKTGWTQKRLVDALGMKSQSALSDKLGRENVSIKSVMEMLNKMGYEIVFQPINGGRRKEGAFVIDGIDPPKENEKK